MTGRLKRWPTRWRCDLETALYSPSLLVSWLWIGIVCLVLLDLRARLYATHTELVFLWAFEDLWTSPVLAGLSNEQCLVLLNPLFVVLLWGAWRAETTSWMRAAGAIRRFTYFATSLVLLALQWALVSVERGLPGWSVVPLG